MALEVEVGWGGNEHHVAKQATACIPPRIQRVACVSLYGNHVLFPQFQLARDIDFEAHIAIIGASDAFSVQIDIAHIHDATKVEQQTAPSQVGTGRKMQAVPTDTHLLESTARQAALDIGSHIGVVGFLVSARLHPGLFYLEVVGHVHRAPFGIVQRRLLSASNVACAELPSEVQIKFLTALRGDACRCDECYGHEDRTL